MKSPRHFSRARVSTAQILIGKHLDIYMFIALPLSLFILLLLPPLAKTFFSYFSPVKGLLDWLFTIFLDIKWHIPNNSIPAEAAKEITAYKEFLSVVQFVLMTLLSYFIAGVVNGSMIEWLYSFPRSSKRARKRLTAIVISPISLTLIYWNRLPSFVNPFEFLLALVAFAGISIYIAGIDESRTNSQKIKSDFPLENNFAKNQIFHQPSKSSSASIELGPVNLNNSRVDTNRSDSEI